jgi:predicted phosphoribosyltransferase
VNLLRKSKPGKIVIGVPVASRSAVQNLAKEVDEIVSVIIPEQFSGVGAFYENFEQVSDEEVMFYLYKLRELKKAG